MVSPGELSCRASVSASTTESALGTNWSRGGREVCSLVFETRTTERIVMDETGTYVVQSVRRVPDEQRCDHRLLQNVRGTPWEPNPGDVSTDLPEPLVIIPQLPDVEPAPTKSYHSDNKGTRNVYIRETDLDTFGCTAGCPACEVHPAGLPLSGQGHAAECRKRLEDVMMTDASTATRITAARVRQTERIIRDLGDSGTTNPSSSSGSGQHKRVRLSDQEHLDSEPETEMQTGVQEGPVTRKRSAETDAERLEEEATEIVEVDSDKRIA